MAFFAIFVPFVANTTLLDRQWSAGLREVLRSSHESVHATIPKVWQSRIIKMINVTNKAQFKPGFQFNTNARWA